MSGSPASAYPDELAGLPTRRLQVELVKLVHKDTGQQVEVRDEFAALWRARGYVDKPKRASRKTKDEQKDPE